MRCVLVLICICLTVSRASDWPQACAKPSSAGCGAVCNFMCSQTPGVVVPLYVFSAQEKAGTCKRENYLYSSRDVAFPNGSALGQCSCVDESCVDCTKNKKPADVDGCCGAAKPLFNYFGQNFPLFDPNAAASKSTCCRTEVTTAGITSSACYCEATTADCFKATTAAPTTTTTVTTTTAAPTTTTVTTTTAATTTTAKSTTLPPPLCPVIPTSRIIGGTQTAACGSGIIRISNGQHVVCNGVVTYNPSGKDKAGNALTKPVIYLPAGCAGSIDAVAGIPGLNVEIKVGDKDPFPYKKEDVTRTPLANSYFEALTLDKYTGGCMDPVCTYDPTTMANSIDKSSCYLLSFGADSTDKGAPVFSGNLNKLEVVYAGTSCSDAITGQRADCFLPVNLGAYTCAGDYGGPIFCSLKTGEKVLYGTFAQAPSCGPNNQVFPVVPINKT